MISRRTFLSRSCLTCAGTLLPLSLASCASHYVTGSIESSGISISTNEFETVKKGVKAFKSFLLIQHEQLNFRIYLYRFSETEYSVVDGVHTGAELQASGDFLYCPSHGSEFNNRGAVSNGPAEKNLREFPLRFQTIKFWLTCAHEKPPFILISIVLARLTVHRKLIQRCCRATARYFADAHESGCRL